MIYFICLLTLFLDSVIVMPAILEITVARADLELMILLPLPLVY